MKGSKRKRPSGAYELRVYAGTDPVSGRERVATRTFRGGARDADEALRDFIKEIEEGKLGGTSATIRALMKKWLTHLERLDRSPTTLREYRRIVAKTINPALGDVQLRRLTARDLDDLYGSLKARKLSPASIRQVHAILRTSLNQAVKWGYVGINVATRATPPPAKAREIHAPTMTEVQALLRYAEKDDPELATLIALAAVTGARRGELCGLRWGDIDWKRKTVTIERSVAIMGRGNLITKDTKTHATRKVALDPLAVTLLKRHQRRVAMLAADTDAEIGPGSPLISYDLTHPIAPDTATHYVRAAARAVGVDTHLHALRHFAATELINAGTNVRTVAGVLGHADPGLTLRVYSHQLEERDRDAAKVLGRALRPAKKALPKPRKAIAPPTDEDR